MSMAQANGVKVLPLSFDNKPSIRKVRGPFIALVKSHAHPSETNENQEHHYVLAHLLEDGSIDMIAPPSPRVKVKLEEFLHVWTGGALVEPHPLEMDDCCGYYG
jgi:hypothetical protein